MTNNPSASAPVRPSVRAALYKRLRGYGLFLMVLLLAAECAALFFHPLELITHFALPILLLAALCSFTFPRPLRYLSWALAAAVLIFALLPFSGDRQAAPGTTLVAYNLHFENRHQAQEIDFLLHSKADILALSEAGGAAWQNSLRTLQQHYPERCGHDVDSPFAMQLLSQQPLLACEVHFSEVYPYIRAVTEKKRTIFLLHPPPPLGHELSEGRLQYFQTVATAIAREANAVLVVGDLNNTPYSPTYYRFKKNAQIGDALPHGTPTWKPLFLPLDRVLYRQGSVFATALPWQYSDHRPLWVEWQ